MLPFSIRKDFLSFSDKKWDWRYPINKDNSVDEKNPTLYELLPSGSIKENLCQLEELL